MPAADVDIENGRLCLGELEEVAVKLGFDVHQLASELRSALAGEPRHVQLFAFDAPPEVLLVVADLASETLAK